MKSLSLIVSNKRVPLPFIIYGIACGALVSGGAWATGAIYNADIEPLTITTVSVPACSVTASGNKQIEFDSTGKILATSAELGDITVSCGSNAIAAVAIGDGSSSPTYDVFAEGTPGSAKGELKITLAAANGTSTSMTTGGNNYSGKTITKMFVGNANGDLTATLKATTTGITQQGTFTFNILAAAWVV